MANSILPIMRREIRHLLLLCALCAWPFWSWSAADDAPSASAATADVWWSDAVAKTLERAGTNREQLILALRQTPAAARGGMEFIITNMPQPDLEQLTAAFLVENLTLAYDAFQKAPWAKSVPPEIFLNDVLPYANVSEQRDNWRAKLRGIAEPIGRGCKTPGEAAQRLNGKMFEQLKVKYSTKRRASDQGPFETMETGFASCTGLSVLLVDACRSVGVPARVVGTPMWSNNSGNHSWVEVWDGDWHFLGAAEPDPKGWITRGSSPTPRPP